MVLPPHPNPSAPALQHFNLANKTAFITGGCRGIGLEVAKGLAEAGADVGITYSSTPADEANKLAADISKATGRTVKAYKCNVTSQEEVTRTIGQAASDLTPNAAATPCIDIIVANAGATAHYPALDYAADKFKQLMDINLNGAMYTAQAGARLMKQRWEREGEGAKSRGSIIFTASVSAVLVNIPQQQSVYNASKAALVHLGKCLAVEWVDFARVNCISPGFIETDILSFSSDEQRKTWLAMIPARRMAQPGELKGAYIFLASDASSYMTGANMIIDGGYSLP